MNAQSGHSALVRSQLVVAVALLSLASMSACSGGSGGAASSVPSRPSTTIAALAPDEQLPPNEPRTWDLAVHCGAGFLSYKINGTWWRTAEAGNTSGWMPTEWPDAAGTGGITVVLEVNAAGDQLSVTHAGRTVVYAPTELTDADLCD